MRARDLLLSGVRVEIYTFLNSVVCARLAEKIVSRNHLHHNSSTRKKPIIQILKGLKFKFVPKTCSKDRSLYDHRLKCKQQ